MKYVCTFAFLIILAVLCGCTTPSYRIRTDATNYRGNLAIEKRDYDFFNGDYIGSGKNCFPPIDNRICPNYTTKVLYTSSKELKMELFSITIRDTSVMTSKVAKDMAYLTAAELTEQRGFKTFTIPYTTEYYTCDSIRSVNTYGTFYGNTYSGTSYLNDNKICANNYNINVLLYDDESDLKNGILYRDNSLSSDRLQPFTYLYVGTTPGLEEEFSSLKQKLENSYEGKRYRFDVTPNAWKTNYAIKSMTEELKKQYGLTEKLPYTFVDEQEKQKKKKEQQNADPIEKYKITK
jgi:hypothetical protein